MLRNQKIRKVVAPVEITAARMRAGNARYVCRVINDGKVMVWQNEKWVLERAATPEDRAGLPVVLGSWKRLRTCAACLEQFMPKTAARITCGFQCSAIYKAAKAKKISPHLHFKRLRKFQLAA